MVYLIGGSPRCGKTILSKRVSRNLGISFISTDAIRPMILKTVPASAIKRKFPQEKMDTPEGMFRLDLYSPEAMLKAQLIEAKTMWLPIKAFIANLINSDQNYIIEGIHIFPRFIKGLKKNKKYWKKIKVVYLIKKDLKKIKAGFPKNKNEFDWMFPSIKHAPHRIEKAADMVRVKSELIEKEAKKYNLKVFNTEGNFNSQLKAAYKYLIS